MRITTLLSTLVLVGSVAGAQANSKGEVGSFVGLTILSSKGADDITIIGIPASGVTGLMTSPALYATFFVSPSIMVEPQVALTHIASGGSHLTGLGLAGQLGYLVSPAATSSPYLAANFAFQSLSDGSTSVSGPAVGAALGYRFTLGTGVALRAEARYRRWFSDFKDLNEIGLGLGIGARF